MIRLLREWLREPVLSGHPVDTADYTMMQRGLLLKKPLLLNLYADFYRNCRRLDQKFFGKTPGLRIEIGSGAGVIKQILPEVITTDIKPIPFIDLIASADHLPVGHATVRAIYGINVFHHLRDTGAFFVEMLRVLQPGGGVILIEPYYGVFARWLFRRLHDTEEFDEHIEDWRYGESIGPMSKANQALSYIVFVRDRERFHRAFPTLEVVYMRPHTHLRYISAGGFSFRALVPPSCESLLKFGEAILSPLGRWLAIQHTIVLRKQRSAETDSRLRLES